MPRKEKEEAGRSGDAVPEEPESGGGERRGGSGPLPWEPAASPSPTTVIGQLRQIDVHETRE